MTSPPRKFMPGDRVKFTKPYMFAGQEHHDSTFFEPPMTREYVVKDHAVHQDQWDLHHKQGHTHVLLIDDKYGRERWVDQECLQLVALIELDEASAIESILAVAHPCDPLKHSHHGQNEYAAACPDCQARGKGPA